MNRLLVVLMAIVVIVGVSSADAAQVSEAWWLNIVTSIVPLRQVFAGPLDSVVDCASARTMILAAGASYKRIVCLSLRVGPGDPLRDQWYRLSFKPPQRWTLMGTYQSRAECLANTIPDTKEGW